MSHYTSLHESSNDAQFHGGLAYKHAWLSHELGKQGSSVEIEELRLEPLEHGKLDLLIEYVNHKVAADSYFLRIPVDAAAVHDYSHFDVCMSGVLDDINTNVRVLLPLLQTLRGMPGVKDISMSYDVDKITLCIRPKKGRRCVFNWDLQQLVREYTQSGMQGDLLRKVIKKAGGNRLPPDHYLVMKSKCGCPRAPIRKRYR